MESGEGSGGAKNMCFLAAAGMILTLNRRPSTKGHKLSTPGPSAERHSRQFSDEVAENRAFWARFRVPRRRQAPGLRP